MPRTRPLATPRTTRLRRTASAMVLALAAALGITATATPAQALTCTPSVPRATCTAMKVHVKSTTSNVRGAKLSECYIAQANSSCTISVAKTVTREIGLALGAQRAWVAGELSISSATSTTITSACTSPPLPKGSYYRAYAKYTKKTYTIQRTRGVRAASRTRRRVSSPP